MVNSSIDTNKKNNHCSPRAQITETKQKARHDACDCRIDNKGLQFYCDFALFIFDMI